MMSGGTDEDRALERAVEDAEGVEVHDFRDRALEREREEAEGIEVFENPDATLHPSALKDGSPGEESLSGELYLEDDEEERR
jgi:hypothetical protein